jgi:ketosteroid isomerase-like protein
MPDDARAEYVALIEEFGRGWEEGDAARLSGVFAEKAAFTPDPFATPLEGRQAIAEYWKDIPYEQSEISFRFGEIHSVGPWFATEFKCTFRRRRSGEPVDLRGALFCETEAGKISEMRMYWHRVKG